MSMSRRAVLKASVAAAAGLSAARGLAGEAGKIPIGIQLYAVRGEFEADVPRTLKAVAGLGYQAVEFWGYGGTPAVFKDYSAKQLRAMLDDNGLKCCGMHLQLKALEDSNLARTVENNQILGNKLLIVAAAQERMKSEETIKGLAEFLGAAAEKVRKQGMRVGYHAHGFDFVKIGGRFAWDILFSSAAPDVVMQMDIGNCLSGDGDPIAMLKKFPGRGASIHLREYQDKTFDGDYYKEVFQLCEMTQKTQWYIVEAGGDGGRGFDVPKQALATLRRIGK